MRTAGRARRRSRNPEVPIQPEHEPDTALLLRAARFAADKHRLQRRKDADASPYINHPLAVADTLARVGGVTDVAVLAAAILHDTIEDTDTTPEEIERQFGAEVRALVQELTDDKRLPKEVRKELQVAHAAASSPGARLVKLGDKICNLEDITRTPPVSWDLARRREFFEWAARVAAGCRGTNDALEARLDEVLRGGREFLAGLEVLPA
ncbi:MAG TPA: HD domain-containing protein [Gemmatimonadales bacterium]|nr:HD domain-containing protein [Gemmatimonadales bacterium]